MRLNAREVICILVLLDLTLCVFGLDGAFIDLMMMKPIRVPY